MSREVDDEDAIPSAEKIRRNRGEMPELVGSGR
jgi:hypothetical protein